MWDVAFLAHRADLPTVLAARGYTGSGVEVGVQRGRYSATILGRSRLSTLILVDPWREDDRAGYRDVANVAQAEQEAALVEARHTLAPFGERAAFWRMSSVEAAARVPDASLDFVYLDARHDYDSVIEDLGAWFPKLRPGGIIAGHDYVDGDLPEGTFGVRSAVDAFFRVRGMDIYSTLSEPAWPTWIAVPHHRHARLAHQAAAVVRARYRVRRQITRMRRKTARIFSHL